MTATSTSAAPWRVAIVGAGYMAGEHARAIAAMPEFRIAGICGRSQPRSEALAAQHGVSAYPDVATLYRQTQADLVVVAVNELSMKAVCEAVFQHPWTSLLEKPVGLNLDEARDIDQMARQASHRAYVALNRRSYSSTRQALGLLGSSRGTRLVSVLDQQDLESARAGGQPEPVLHNYMFANSIHLVDYFNVFCRGRPVQIDVPVPWRADAPGTVVAVIRYDSGDCGVYQAIWDGPGPWSVTVTDQELRLELRPLERLGVQRRGERRLTEVAPESIDTDFKPGLYWQARQLADLRGGRTPGLASLTDAVDSMHLVARLYGLDSGA